MEESKVLLSLDMSTTCTGYSIFSLPSGELLTYGKLKPVTKGGVLKMTYPKQQLTKMKDLANQILELILNFKPEVIVIEEIAGSKSRHSQKTLDGFHYVVVWVIEEYLNRVVYYDVTGTDGWRTHLQLRLSDADKAANKEAKKLNKKLRGCQKLPVIGPKHLACRHVNAKFNKAFNVDLDETDGDITDSIAMGDAYITFHFARAKK